MHWNHSRREILKALGWSVCIAGTGGSRVLGQSLRETGEPKAVEEDVPGLPRVLIIGDSISVGYTPFVRAMLQGRANVHRIMANGGPTTNGLAHLDEWLGSISWDVIHCNWGLHDIKHLDAAGKHVAVDQGRLQVPIDQYDQNLEVLVQRLQKTGAELIWASTTPVPEGALGRIPGYEVRYNTVAEKIMHRHNVMINDLYHCALPKLKDIQLPANVHFRPHGYEQLAREVVLAIEKALPGSR